MRHFFISSAAVHSPRWQQAFPDARLLNSPTELPPLSAEDVVWLLIDDLTDATLSACVALSARVVALTQREDVAEAQRVLAMGVGGYLHYLATPAVLVQVDQVVRHNGLWLGAELMRQLVLGSARRVPVGVPGLRLQDLTPRERAVAEAVAAGKNNKEVARELSITERTVKAHLSAAFEKLGVRDRLHLVLVLAG